MTKTVFFTETKNNSPITMTLGKSLTAWFINVIVSTNQNIEGRPEQTEIAMHYWNILCCVRL